MAESREEFAESTSSAFDKKNRASNLIYIRKLTLCYLCADELASRLCLHSFAKVVIFF